MLDLLQTQYFLSENVFFKLKFVKGPVAGKAPKPKPGQGKMCLYL